MIWNTMNNNNEKNPYKVFDSFIILLLLLLDIWMIITYTKKLCDFNSNFYDRYDLKKNNNKRKQWWNKEKNFKNLTF